MLTNSPPIEPSRPQRRYVPASHRRGFIQRLVRTCPGCHNECMSTKLKKIKQPRRGRPKHSDEGVKARGRLLDSAEALFAERGLFGVTTRQVADAAGVDVALI